MLDFLLPVKCEGLSTDFECGPGCWFSLWKKVVFCAWDCSESLEKVPVRSFLSNWRGPNISRGCLVAFCDFVLQRCHSNRLAIPCKCKSCFSNRALVKAIFEALKCLQIEWPSTKAPLRPSRCKEEQKKTLPNFTNKLSTIANKQYRECRGVS